MRSKEEFLHQLQQGISVLEESEQQDILQEYAQHIQLNMAGGMSEEEAVQEFGDVHQLVSEILEAYHVDPSYGEKADSPSRWAWLGRTLQAGARKAAAWARRSPQGRADGATQETADGRSGPIHTTGAGWLRRVPRLVWNLILLLCAIPVVFCGMAGLLLLGIVVVWLTQGMPLMGALIWCVGVLLACVGLLGLGKALIWHRPGAAGAHPEDKEVSDHVE